MNRFILAGLMLVWMAPVAEAQEPDRVKIRKKMEEVMGPLPGADRKVPLDMQVLEETKLDGITRKKITFAVEKGDRVPAYLLIPNKINGKCPAALCLHQTVAIGKGEPVGLNKDANKHYALELAQRGYICLAPDYPSFGDYPFDFKKSDFASGSMKAIWNNMRAVDLLQSIPEVDPAKIAAIGHSLGGHNSMFTAAFDERIKVIVSCCGFCSFHKYYGGNLTGWTSDRYMPWINTKFGKDAKKMPFDFTDVVISFAPRAFMAVAPLHDNNFDVGGVRDVMAAAAPVYESLKAKKELVALYPDAKHDFPKESRQAAYEFMDERLNR